MGKKTAKKEKKVKWWMVVVALVVIAIFAPSSEDEEVSKEMPTPEPTVEATFTPTPTATPIPTEEPTETPVPTLTPTETPTPEPTATNTPKPTATPKPTNTPKPTATSTPTPVPIDEDALTEWAKSLVPEDMRSDLLLIDVELVCLNYFSDNFRRIWNGELSEDEAKKDLKEAVNSLLLEVTPTPKPTATPKPTSTPTPVPVRTNTPTPVPTENKIIGNVKSNKYHTRDCGRLPDEENRIYFDSVEDAKAAGMTLCGHCNRY